MKRLLFFLFSLSTLISAAQVPEIYATVSGSVTYAGTNLPVPGHIVQVSMYSNDSTGTAMLEEVYTDNNGQYFFTGSIIGTDGYIQVQSEICNGQYQTEIFPMSINAVNDFYLDFYVCGTTDCQAYFYWDQISDFTFQFLNQSIGEDLSYYWSFGDGTYSSEFNPVKTYSNTGMYDVTLYISRPDSSCFSSITQYLFIGDTIVPGCQAWFEPIQTDPNGFTYSFIDKSMGNIDTWFWDFGDGNTTNGQFPVHTYIEPGIYQVCLTISSPDSTCYDYFCQTLAVGGTNTCLAQFTWYPVDSVNNQFTTQFLDLSYGNFTDWSWSFGDGTGSNEQNPVHNFASPGIYTVCLTVSGPDCQSSWCSEVYIDVIYPMCFNYFTYVNAGTSVEFTGYHSTDIPATYQWEFGDGTTALGNPVTHIYQTPGIYYVTLSTWDDNQCYATSSMEVVIGDTIVFNQVYGQVYEGNWPLTSGFVMIFSSEADTNYYPYFDMTPVDGTGVFAFPMVPNGNYNILAIPTDGSTYLPTYYESTLFWQEATVIVAGQTQNPVNIQLVSAQGSATPGNGFISGQINQGGLRDGFIDQIVVYLTDSDYHILDFTQVNSNGEFSFSNLAYGTYYIKPELSGVYSDYRLVNLSAAQTEVMVNLTFTGNYILSKPEGMSVAADVTIYPNPVTESARIIFNQTESGIVSLSLLDLSGRNILNQTEKIAYGAAQIDIPVKTILPGVYILKLRFVDGTEVSRKLIKN